MPRKQSTSRRAPSTKKVVDRTNTPFDFSLFDLPALRKKVISTTLVALEARRRLDSELMVKIFEGLEETRIFGFLEFSLPLYSLERIVEFFCNSEVDGDSIRRLLRTRIRVGDAAPLAYIEFIDRENELRQSKPPTPQPPQRAPLDPWIRSQLTRQFALPKEEKSSESDN